jgi:hypothetical protein
MITTDVDADGNAWWKPDAIVGSEKYYTLDWSEWLTAENDTLNGSAIWFIPAGLTNMDEQNLAPLTSIKLRADAVGTYIIECKVPTIESPLTQKMIQRVHLTVK